MESGFLWLIDLWGFMQLSKTGIIHEHTPYFIEASVLSFSAMGGALLVGASRTWHSVSEIIFYGFSYNNKSAVCWKCYENPKSRSEIHFTGSHTISYETPKI